MYSSRKSLYSQLEQARRSKVLVYVTGDRRQLETKIHSETVDFFVSHLDRIGDVEKISLVLYTNGGDTLAAWNIINLINQFCKELEIIVPAKARSAGTLMCLGAKTILMTKQATLGPIDPSVNTPLNPAIPGAPPTTKYPVSVESVNSFVEFVRGSIEDKAQTSTLLSKLVDSVHPLVLGDAFRARSQIRMLAEKLLSSQIQDTDKIEKILKFLCSESGSHDYTINRKEARDDLALPVEKPDESLYELINNIYIDIAAELELTTPFEPNVFLGTENTKPYRFPRALIESVDGGSDVFVSEGTLSKQQIQVPPGVMEIALRDNRTFEGWRHHA
jgi:hypothetical protein